MSKITISDLNTDNFLSELTADELEIIQGGDWIDWLDRSWTDIKKGIADAWNSN